MPYPSVTENWSVREFQPGESALRSFYVTDADNEQQAIGLVGIGKGDEFSLDTSLLAEAPSAKSPRNPRQFEVSVKYSKRTGDGTEQPEKEPPRFRIVPQKCQIPVDRDRLGNPIVNSVGESFEQSVARDYTDLVYEYRRLEKTHNLALAIDYQDAVNSDRVLLPGAGYIDPGQGKLDLYVIEEERTRLTKTAWAMYRISIRRDGWKTRILDQSYNCWATLNGRAVPTPILNASNGTLTPVSAPVRLNGSGQPLNPADWRVFDKDTQPNTGVISPAGAELERNSTAVFLRYELYNPRPFSALLLRL